MIQAMVQNVAKNLNMFPTESGFLDTMSPLSIVVGTATPNYNKLKLEFGAYIQVYKDYNIKNKMEPWITGALALNHIGNAQGNYYFMSLLAGCQLTQHQ